IQTIVSDDVAVNLNKTIKRIEEASRKGAQIVCLQELYRTKYFPQEEKKKVVIIAPIFETAKGKYYNSAVIIDANGEISGSYRKVHLPHDPLFYEKNYFDQGNTGYSVYKTQYAHVGVLICYDQWFPEPARINALKGAEIIFYPTAIGWIKGYTLFDGDWHDAWKTVQRANAIMNGVHVAAVNRVGEEEQLKFWGGSFVCDSFGKVLKE